MCVLACVSTERVNRLTKTEVPQVDSEVGAAGEQVVWAIPRFDGMRIEETVHSGFMALQHFMVWKSP